MSLISYNKLVELVESGVINAPIENINGASIDITLDPIIMFEQPKFENRTDLRTTVDLAAKESIRMSSIEFFEFVLSPGEFILASTAETFNLPNNIACEYKLKSSLARSGLQHALAGWADPGWNNSKLTLELSNATRFHQLKLTAGMKIGQMVFFECDPVPDEHSYATKGQYNNQDKVTANKGVR
jgi:dCTP deaminase